jgi:large subunit ribosomal protein L32e
MTNPRKKPKFLRQSSIAYVRLGKKWRRPRGIHSKLRRHEAGKGFIPSPGYRAPILLRGLHPSGFREVIVSNLTDLEKVDAKTEAIKISATVGKKKRGAIVEKANQLKIKILNP